MMRNHPSSPSKIIKFWHFPLFIAICLTTYTVIYVYLLSTDPPKTKKTVKIDTRDDQPPTKIPQRLKDPVWGDTKIIQLPKPAKLMKIKGITIRGERHSGTGYLRTILKANCPNLTFTVLVRPFKKSWYFPDNYMEVRIKSPPPSKCHNVRQNVKSKILS